MRVVWTFNAIIVQGACHLQQHTLPNSANLLINQASKINPITLHGIKIGDKIKYRIKILHKIPMQKLSELLLTLDR